jgi:phosphohistidine phosphatase
MMQAKPDYFYTQSAVIPFRKRTGKLEILMITSRNMRRWIIPKGVKEPDLSPQDSAAKEALEEAGASGRLSSTAVGSYSYEKWGGVCTVQVYAMAVEHLFPDWEESHRGREWVPLEEAVARTDEADLRALLASLPAFLERDAP